MEKIAFDFRVRLNEELARRCQQNPNYSLRAFAKFLEIDFSSLSKMMRGKRTVGPRVTLRLGNRLGLNPAEIHKYTSSRNQLKAETKSSREYLRLTEDVFQVLSELYYYSILELTLVKGASAETKWIADALGIPESETKIALERMERLEMIAKNDQGKWIRIKNPNITTLVDGYTSSAHRKIQGQILNRAKVALETLPIEKRDQTSMTMAINSSKIPAAKRRIAKFRRELDDFLGEGDNLDQVYCLSVGLFPLTDLQPETQVQPPTT